MSSVTPSPSAVHEVAVGTSAYSVTVWPDIGTIWLRAGTASVRLTEAEFIALIGEAARRKQEARHDGGGVASERSPAADV